MQWINIGQSINFRPVDRHPLEITPAEIAKCVFIIACKAGWQVEP